MLSKYPFVRLVVAYGIASLWWWSLIARGVEDSPPLAFFFETTTKDLSADDVSTYVVAEVDFGSPADVAGLEAGDIILAIDGRRIYGVAEAVYLERFLRANNASAVVIARRGKRVREFRLERIPIGGDCGIVVQEERSPWVDLVGRFGGKLQPEQEFVLACTPPRAALLAERWLNDNPSRGKQGDWVRDLVRLRLSLAEQDWKTALAIDPAPPVPELKSLVDFWHSVARRNADRELPPDPAAHAVDLDYYCFHYPAPRYVPPPLGDFETDDGLWKAALEAQRANPLRQRSIEEAQTAISEAKRPHGPVDGYLATMKQIALRPAMQEWAYKYEEQGYSVRVHWERMYEDASKLRDEASSRALALFALSQLASVQFDRREEALASLEALHELSPLLAWRAANSNRAMFALGASERETGRKLKAWWAAHAGPLAPKERIFATYVLERSRPLESFSDPFLLPPTNPRSYYFPGVLREAIEHREPVDAAVAALRTDVDAGVYDDEPEQFVERFRSIASPDFRQTERIPFFNYFDEREFAGAWLDGWIEILASCDVPDEERKDFVKALYGALGPLSGRDDKNDRSYDEVVAALEGIAWTDAADAEAKTDALFRQKGSLASTVRISNVLREKGLASAADRYDARLQRFFELSLAWFEFDSVIYGNGHRQLARSYADHPPSAERMERELSNHRRAVEGDGDAFTLYLADAETYRSHCLITLGRFEEAAAALADSYNYNVPNVGNERFYFGGKTATDLGGYRRMLIDRLVDERKLPQATRRALLSLPDAEQ